MEGYKLSKKATIILLTVSLSLVGGYSDHAESGPISTFWKTILKGFLGSGPQDPLVDTIILPVIKQQETKLSKMSFFDLVSEYSDFERPGSYIDSKINELISEARLQIRNSLGNDQRYSTFEPLIDRQFD